MQLPLSQSRLHPSTASAAYLHLNFRGCYQNVQASSYHSCPQIASLVKNPRAHSLQSPVPNQQLPAVTPAQIPSRTLHHPANPFYPIILLSRPFSTPGTSHLMFSDRAIYITAQGLWN